MAFEADEELLLSAKLEQSFAPSFELDSEDHGILRFIIQQSSRLAHSIQYCTVTFHARADHD